MNVTPRFFVRLPSMGNFVTRIAETVGKRRHVALVLGQTLPPEFQDALVDACVETCFGTTVDAGLQSADAPPNVVIAAARGGDPGDYVPGGIHKVTADGLGDAPIIVTGLRDGPADLVRTWSIYLEKIGRLGWASADSLFVPLVASDALKSDRCLDVVDFWSEVSALDISLLCREACGGERDPASVWREAVLPDVVGADLGLLAAAWEAVLQDETALAKSLAAYGAERGWGEPHRTLLAEPARRQAPTTTLAPSLACPPAWRSAWAEGLAYATRDTGPTLSSAALAWSGREDHQRELVHRIWRGQARLLLPRIDEIRLRVCQALTDKHGRSWPTRFHRFKYEEDEKRAVADPRSVEYGALFHITRDSAAHASAFFGLVGTAREIRNELAHYKPVTYSQYRSLVDKERAVFKS